MSSNNRHIREKVVGENFMYDYYEATRELSVLLRIKRIECIV